MGDVFLRELAARARQVELDGQVERDSQGVNQSMMGKLYWEGKMAKKSKCSVSKSE